MIVEVNVTIDLAEGVDIDSLSSQIEAILAEVNGQPTSFNIVHMDDAISKNPLNYRVS